MSKEGSIRKTTSTTGIAVKDVNGGTLPSTAWSTRAPRCKSAVDGNLDFFVGDRFVDDRPVPVCHNALTGGLLRPDGRRCGAYLSRQQRSAPRALLRKRIPLSILPPLLRPPHCGKGHPSFLYGPPAPSPFARSEDLARTACLFYFRERKIRKG
jgi:hypothetical protein